MFLSYLLKYLADSDKICYVVFGINLSRGSVGHYSASKMFSTFNSVSIYATLQTWKPWTRCNSSCTDRQL